MHMILTFQLGPCYTLTLTFDRDLLCRVDIAQLALFHVTLVCMHRYFDLDNQDP